MLKRAYSLLEVKEVTEEEDAYVVRGMATTPTPDRMNDVVDPLGAKFAPQIPLLWQHDSDKPVGITELGKPTKKGIPFVSRIPKVKEAGTLRDRIEEAVQSIRYKLVAAVSIGFRILNDAIERLENGGYHYLETEILELSLVTIPAQPDAKITGIKSIDTRLRAASGHTQKGVFRLPSPAGASAPKAKRAEEAKSMNVAEQIKSFEAKRAASAERMEAIMAKAAEESRTLDETETEEYDGLDVEVKGVDEHLSRLRKLEKAQAAKAKAVERVDTIENGSNARAGIITIKETLPPGIEFARYVKCLAFARGNAPQALEVAKNWYPDQTRIHNVLKATVAGATTTDSTWAGPLFEYQTFAGDFVEYLRPATIIGKFGTNGIPSLRRVPFNVRIVGQTSGGDGYWVGQGAPKPLTKFDFNAVQLGHAKVANIAVLSDELVRFSNPSADALVRDALRDALLARLDTDFVDPDKAVSANVSPASITNGATAIASSGSTLDAVTADVQAVMTEFINANMSVQNGVWIMSAVTALALSMMRDTLGRPAFPTITMNGGTFAGLPVIVSQYVTNTTSGANVILVSASDIWLADDGQVVIDASREASLQMLDNPTNNSASATATTMVSMFQTNSVAIRAERFINWQARRNTDEAKSVVYLTGVQWSGNQT
jgi:HK97 family phage major capsid protein/HK97 family phage prohead protease